MSKSAVYWDGSVNITYKDVELDVDVIASGTYYYSPGCMYRRNGDPGDPPEEETDIDKLDVEAVYLDDINITSWLKPEVIKEIEDLCYEAIEDGQLGNGEGLDPEPYDDYDDYEPEDDD